MRSPLGLGLLCGASALTLVPAEVRADAFWSAWGDGKAELSGYRLVQPRYGQVRDGHAVLIYVTEDFSDSARVKADPGKHPPADVYPVLKLNAIRKFQTGIYDYSVMTSTFARVDAPAGGRIWPLRKVSFSSQEWCGHVYHQLLPQADGGGNGRLVSVSHSYFDEEADDVRDLPWPTGAAAGTPGPVLEDELPVLLRPFAGKPALLEPGKSVTVPFLPSLLRARLLHRKLAWTTATISRAAAAQLTLDMPAAPAAQRGDAPAGKVEAVVFTVMPEPRGPISTKSGPETGTFFFAAAPPHRLLRWRWSGGPLDGEEGTLLGSTRLPYWQLHDSGQESYLKQLGLPAPVAPTAPARPGQGQPVPGRTGKAAGKTAGPAAR